ncbi:hypothetical protein ACSSS7_000025 [Eimeria intestinalis]
MEEHRLAVPLCALEVASSELPPAAVSNPSAAGRRGTVLQPLLGKHQSVVATAEACSDALNSELQASAVAASCLPLGASVETKGEGGHRSAATSSAVTRRNSSFGTAEGNVTSTSPDGSYISSPFFTGSPMDFPDTLQPRAINIASDVQCSLSTPLEKFFDVLDSTDTPVATPSPLATVCTHHTTSAAADAFPLNGSLAHDAEVPGDATKQPRAGEHDARVASPENFSSSSAFPIRPAEATVHKHVKEQQTRSFPSSRRSSSHDGTSRTTTCGESSDAGLLEGRGLSAFPCGKGEEEALDTAASSGASRGTFPQEKSGGADEVATSDADRLLVDFQLLLILLFDQVCNVVPGLRRQDGGAFYSLHLQRIAAGPLHPTLASYADVLLPICSAMNFFSEDKNTEARAQKQDEQDSILSVALRYLARHGTIPAAPIADTVAKCPAAVFIQVVSALECMYSLQRMLAPGSSEHRERVSAELDPKTIWGDAVVEMEKAAGVLAEECVADSVLPRGAHEDEGLSSSQLLPPPPSLDHASRPSKRPRSLSECTTSRKQVASASAATKHDAEPENRGSLASPSLTNLSPVELNGTAASVTSNVNLPSGAVDCGLLPSARGEGSPAFISASVNKRRHPNVQAEILNSCCPERLAQRGTRLLGEVLQKLHCEQALRPSCAKTHSPKQPVEVPLHEPPEAAPGQQEGACGVLLPGRDCDSFSGGSARGKRKPSAAGEHTLGEALATLSTPQHAGAAGCCPTPPELEALQPDGAAESHSKRHGYGLRKGAAKKGRRSAEEAAAARGAPRLTPVKTQHPQQMRAKTAAGALSPGETMQQDPSTSLPPNLTEQLMKLAKGADGDFPAALSSTMRGVFFNRSLNRWVCTWSRNGKEYQRSWSAGKYGYETARGLAMHCRLEKLLSGEAHTLQKGMLAVFKPVINSQVSPASVDSTVASSGRLEPASPEEAERRKPDVQKLRSSPHPTHKGENTAACREPDSSQLTNKKHDQSTEAPAAAAVVVPKPQPSSTYSDMLTLMSQAISRNPEAFSFEGEATEATAKTGASRDKDSIKELGDPSVGEHFLAAVAAAAAVCDVPGFED